MTERAALLAGIALCVLVRGASAQTREIAVTFDDLPVRTTVFATDLSKQREITTAILATIQRHHIPVIGFVIGSLVAPDGPIDTARTALLRSWTAPGLELGNHTWSHLDLHTVPLATYEADLARDDSLLTALRGGAATASPKWFRHPYLHTGRDAATRSRLARYLRGHGYRVAPVTVDNEDYVFAAAYEQALAAKDSAAARSIGDTYVPYMLAMVAFYEQQADALFGHAIRQVLLLHANALNADCFERIASGLTARGYRFVNLAHAVADPAYGTRDDYFGPAGITWIHRWALTSGHRGAFFAGEPQVPEWVRTPTGR